MNDPARCVRTCALCLIAAIVASAPIRSAAEPVPAAPNYAVRRTIPVGGDGRWDYAFYDPAAHRLYVTRTIHTQVLDPDSGKLLLDVPGQKRSHGAIPVPDLGRGFITDGQAATILVFDLKTGQVLGNVPAADDADGEIYDPGTHRILVSCGDAHKLLVLDPSADPKTAKVDAVDLGGKPEFLAADGHGTAYVTVNDKNEIAVVDLKSLKVTARHPTGSGAKPTGMAIDAEHGRLFIGCRNGKLVVMNTADGKVLADLPIGQGNDACAFDPATGLAFASQADGTLAVVGETAPGTFAVVQTVKTPLGAKTMAIDPSTHTLYLPTAEFEPAQQGQRPTPKPGTFMIVVVGPAEAK